MSVTLTFKEEKLLRRFDKLGEKWKVQIKKQVEKSATAIEKEAKELAPVGVSGGAGLRGSISILRKDKGLSAEVGVNSLGKKPLPYAASVEYGIEKGRWIPVGNKKKGYNENLYTWVRLKLGVSKERDIVSTMHAIQKVIHRKGTEPQPYLQPAFDRESPLFVRRLKKILKKVR